MHCLSYIIHNDDGQQGFQSTPNQDYSIVLHNAAHCNCDSIDEHILQTRATCRFAGLEFCLIKYKTFDGVRERWNYSYIEILYVRIGSPNNNNNNNNNNIKYVFKAILHAGEGKMEYSRLISGEDRQ